MAEMEEVQFGGTQWKKCMIQIIVLQRLNEKYEREIDGEIRKNYINSYNISVGNIVSYILLKSNNFIEIC